MTLDRPRTLLALVMILALLLPLGGALAHEDGEDAEAEVGPLEIEARPSIVSPGERVFVEAEYELEADDEEEEDDDGDEAPDEDADDEADEADDDADDEADDDADEADDEADDDADEPDADDDAEDDEADDDEADDDAGAATEAAQVPSTVVFSVQWGDGAASETMTVTEEEVEEDEFESEAVTSRILEETGTVQVTVTATPDEGEEVSASVSIHVGNGSTRLAGENRLATGLDVARESFPEDGSAGAVLLARADEFADALSAASLALLEDAPILLSPTATLPDAVLAEVDRALGDAGTVYLLGGEQALAPAVAEAVEARGHTVQRIAGGDRIDTALQIGEFLAEAGDELDEAVIASAGDYPDALSAASFAAAGEDPVLLTGSDQLDPRVAAFLERHGDTLDEVHIAGGTQAVGQNVADALTDMGLEVERLDGRNRYETSAEIAEQLFPNPDTVVLATGGNFADALSGAAQAGRTQAPVLLVGAELPESAREYLDQRAGSIDAVYTLGGNTAVPDSVQREVNAILGLD